MLGSLLRLGLKWPRSVLASAVLLVVVAALLVTLGPLQVSTSREGLVSLKSPHQARLFNYYAAFGRSQVAALVISGETAEERRSFVDRFEAELDQQPEFEGRVLGKLALDSVAETVLVWRPELAALLPQLTAGLEPGADPWLSWARAAEQRLTSELEGSPSTRPAALQAAPDSGVEQLGRVADALKALRQALAGDGRLAIGELGVKSGGSHVDEHGYLVGAGGDFHLVLIFPVLESDEGRELQPLVQSIRGARDRALAASPGQALRADLTGAPALAVDELTSLQAGSQITSVLSTAGIFLLLMLAFRSFRHVAVLLLPLLAGMLITLGFVELVYDGLNLVTSSFMSVLLGLGIEFGVHLMHRYGEARLDGEELRPALETALLTDGPAVALGAVTTATAFLTTTTTEFRAFSELGVITAVGLALTLGCTLFLFPVLLPIVAGKRQARLHDLPGLPAVLQLVGRRAPWVVGAGVLSLLLAGMSLFVARPGFNGRTFDFLPASAESYRGMLSIERAGTPPLDAHFVVGSFGAAADVAERLRQTPEVSAVQSPSDLLPRETPEQITRIRQAMAQLGSFTPVIPPASAAHARERLDAFRSLSDALDELAFALRQANRDASEATRAGRELAQLTSLLAGQPDQGTQALNRVGRALEQALARALGTARNIAARGSYAAEDLPPVFAARFVSKDGARLAVHAYPAGNVEEASFGERFAEKLRAIDPDVAGTALNLLPHERYITEGFQRAAGYSLLLITLILWLTFRRVDDTLLALLPVLLAAFWMLALMHPLGIRFTPANMVALPLLFGIGLDSGVHMVHRSRESSGAAPLATLVQGTGSAVSVAALTNAVGFAALIAADYRAMQDLGLLLSIGISLTIVASVVVLPALLVILRRAGLDGDSKAPAA
ncbi:MAG TPA: MMPL family transporter [Polyangiaceae bacterium]|nr:MMPL family transporter [Polyangiaceae bacterium]